MNAISPHHIDTPIFECWQQAEALPRLKDDLAKNVPLSRLGDPDEIAEAVSFLASDETSYISGIELFVDGGAANLTVKGRNFMNWFINQLAKIRLLRGDFDYHFVRVSMVIIYFFFGYQKWFDYEVKELIPFFTHGPLIFWMYAVFGMKGSTYFLGVSEWLFGALILAGFWNKKLGVLGALGSIATFLCTVTIIPFMPDGWAKSAGGFPAMVGNVAFLMKDVVLLAVSVYLLKQDLTRAMLADETTQHEEPGDLAPADLPGHVKMSC